MVGIPSFVSWLVLASVAAGIAIPTEVDSNGSINLPTASEKSGKPEKAPKCKQILKRKAWHTLSKKEKKAYLNAELCLMKLPTKTKLEAAVSRFDDLIKLHQIQANRVHGDGWFLPFHRLQMAAHEQLLPTECGYKGAQPWWDETIDAGTFSKSEIFDAEYGFGGDGSGPEFCIQDGPFANYTLSTGPGRKNIKHCIWRQISDFASAASAQAITDECYKLNTYAEAWPCFENGIKPGQSFTPPPPEFLNGETPWPPTNFSFPPGGIPGFPGGPPGNGSFVFAQSPHNGGHGGVGGEMANPVSSPGDPLFYLHHTFLDRIWWIWQKGDLKNRLVDIAGYTSQFALPGVPGGFINATLDDELDMFGIIPNATVREIMNIREYPLCFDYE